MPFRSIPCAICLGLQGAIPSVYKGQHGFPGRATSMSAFSSSTRLEILWISKSLRDRPGRIENSSEPPTPSKASSSSLAMLRPSPPPPHPGLTGMRFRGANHICTPSGWFYQPSGFGGAGYARRLFTIAIASRPLADLMNAACLRKTPSDLPGN